jgi:hypothetical protein
MGIDYKALFPNQPRDSTIVPGHQQHSAEGPIGTGRAILWVPIHGPAEWVPRSHIIKHTDTALLITSWLAKQKGWDDPKAMAERAEDEMYEEVRMRPYESLFDPDLDDEIPF